MFALNSLGNYIVDKATIYLLDNQEACEVMIAHALAYVKERFNLSKNYVLWKNSIDDIFKA